MKLRLHRLLAAGLALLAPLAESAAQPPAPPAEGPSPVLEGGTPVVEGAPAGSIPYPYPVVETPARSTSYPKGDFQQHLQAASGDGAGACDWGWGAGGSPFRTGPGCNDTYRLGPRWCTSFEGGMLFREETEIGPLLASANAGSVVPGGADTLFGNFEHSGAARLTVSSYWPQCQGYGLEIAYLGAFEFGAQAFDPEVPPSIITAPPDLAIQKSLTYTSSLHSLEIDVTEQSERAVDFYFGVRYILLAEDIDDFYDETRQPPVAGVLVPVETTDILRAITVDNNLVGIQGGLKGQLLSLGDRVRLEGFVNGGCYCNVINRDSHYAQTRSFVQQDDPATTNINEGVVASSTSTTGYRADRSRVAFAGETWVAAAFEVNRCTKARLGYQALLLNGVELADTAFTGVDPLREDLLLHGWFFGIEHRR